MARGCSNLSLYFHNQQYQDTTAEIKKQVDTLDVSAAFKSLTDNADDLAKQEDAAVVASGAVMRDEELTKLIDPIPQEWQPLPSLASHFAKNKAAGRLAPSSQRRRRS